MHRCRKAARTVFAGSRAAASLFDKHAPSHKATDAARRRAARLAGEVAALPITVAKDALLREVREEEAGMRAARGGEESFFG